MADHYCSFSYYICFAFRFSYVYSMKYDHMHFLLSSSNSHHIFLNTAYFQLHILFFYVSLYINPVNRISAVHMSWDTYQLPPPPQKHNQFSLRQQISLSIAPSHWVCLGLMQGGTAAESLRV